MKKFICIIFANIIILLTMLMLANIYVERNILDLSLDHKLGFNRFFYHKFVHPDVNIENIPHEPTLVEMIPRNEETLNDFCDVSKFLFKEDSKAKPIIVLGCSYAYGHGLKKEETFLNMLSELTKRPVYSYAFCGATLSESLQDFLNDTENKERISQADNVIYIYMYDHINRILQIKRIYEAYVDLFGNSENKIHNFLLNKFALYKFVCCSIQLKKILSEYPNTEKSQEFLKKTILVAYKKIKMQVPNAKMTIILYEEKIPDNRSSFEISYVYEFINSKIWKELEEETNGDVQIVRTKDVMGFYFDKDYKLEKDIADWHPSARAWREFTPKFVSQYIK